MAPCEPSQSWAHSPAFPVRTGTGASSASSSNRAVNILSVLSNRVENSANPSSKLGFHSRSDMAASRWRSEGSSWSSSCSHEHICAPSIGADGFNTVPPKDANTSAGGSGSSGETTVFKGYVSDASGKEKIGLTETTDKDGKVIKTTYTTTDKDGKVIAVKTYGPDGKLISDTKAPSQSSAAAAVARETAKTIARPPRPAIPSCSCP